MKNTQKKKITRNYHLLMKAESGKCRGVTAVIDVIRINSDRIQMNAQIGKRFFPARKRLVEQCCYFAQMMVTEKEKLPQLPHRFGCSVI